MSELNVLSIDFDFWVPEKLEFDWGHQESPIFLDAIWAIRAAQMLSQGTDLRKELQCDEYPKPEDIQQFFRDKKWRFQKNYRLAAGESHLAAFHDWKDLPGNLNIYHVDAHHDFSYQPKLKPLDCGNWVGHLVKTRPVNKIHLVYPTWRQNQYNTPKGDGNCDYPSEAAQELIKGMLKSTDTDALSITYGLDTLPDGVRIDAVFLARSGAWVPPWLDETFLQLFHSFVGKTDTIFFYGWKDVLEILRSFPDWEEIEENAQELKSMMEQFQKNHC